MNLSNEELDMLSEEFIKRQLAEKGWQFIEFVKFYQAGWIGPNYER